MRRCLALHHTVKRWNIFECNIHAGFCRLCYPEFEKFAHAIQLGLQVFIVRNKGGKFLNNPQRCCVGGNYKMHSGAIIGEGDCKSWDPRAPMIWDNFSIFRTNCGILTSYIHVDPRTYRGFSRGCHIAGRILFTPGCIELICEFPKQCLIITKTCFW